MPKEKFVRFGKLKPVKQKGFDSYDEESWFHSPPKGRGFYAFPRDFVEIFLVSQLSYQSDVSRSLPTKTIWEKSLWWNSSFNEYNLTWYDYEMKDIWQQMRRFEVGDDKYIWHHLDEYIKDKTEIIKTSKAWCMTTVAVWRKALNRACNDLKMQTWRQMKDYKPNEKISIKEVKRTGYYSIDHFEVFFDHKIS